MSNYNKSGWVGLLFVGIGLLFVDGKSGIDAPKQEVYNCVMQGNRDDNQLSVQKNFDIIEGALQDNKVYGGVHFDKLYETKDGEFFADTRNDIYSNMQLHCTRKDK